MEKWKVKKWERIRKRRRPLFTLSLSHSLYRKPPRLFVLNKGEAGVCVSILRGQRRKPLHVPGSGQLRPPHPRCAVAAGGGEVTATRDSRGGTHLGVYCELLQDLLEVTLRLENSGRTGAALRRVQHDRHHHVVLVLEPGNVVLGSRFEMVKKLLVWTE